MEHTVRGGRSVSFLFFWGRPPSDLRLIPGSTDRRAPRHTTQVIGVQECMVMDGLKEAILDHVGRETYMWSVSQSVAVLPRMHALVS